MLARDVLLLSSLAYVAFLFAIAFWADRSTKKGGAKWVKSPWVYTLSISVYCTAWTFYGAVGSASRNGLEFATIYIGPTIMFIGWWWLLRKLVRISHVQGITSIADLISSRYGKSNGLAVAVTLLCTIASTPYIALQLQSLTLSFSAFSGDSLPKSGATGAAIAFYIAAGLAIFTIFFGTRNVEINERHYGVIMAIAVEAIIKLFAIVSVGVFVVWGVFGDLTTTLSAISKHIPHHTPLPNMRWTSLIMLSAVAVICLPRMFQVIVVENEKEDALFTASWAFPLYLLVLSIFVLPIAVAGKTVMPEGANPDLFVLTVPLSQGQEFLSLIAFIGGFSAATSMVIVAAIALSTMISNHIIMPLWLETIHKGSEQFQDIRNALLTSRRIAIILVLGMGYLYFLLTGGSEALAAIGLIAFAGAAQLMPALIGGIFWRRATKIGAYWGLSIGFALWAYTLLLPSFEGHFLLSKSTIENGPYGLSWLRPRAFLGLEGMDPLVHALFWSLGANIIAFLIGSLTSEPEPLERLQAAEFVNVFEQQGNLPISVNRSATTQDLFNLAQRILGTEEAHHLFSSTAKAQGLGENEMPNATPDFVSIIERRFTNVMGSATAHAMVSQIAGVNTVTIQDLIQMADETAQIVEYSQKLEESSAKLREANEKLTLLSAQKDAFLSQVSHELRTPMTSIRSFSEILKTAPDIAPAQRDKYIGIIHNESIRLTTLLDEILDLSLLESGKVDWILKDAPILQIVESAYDTMTPFINDKGFTVEIHDSLNGIDVHVEPDRLTQVFINLITNALKYGAQENGQIEIKGQKIGKLVYIIVHDNGPGIAAEKRDQIFEKFTRATHSNLAGSAGLGLAISREIMRNIGGDLELLSTETGTSFRLKLQLSETSA